MFGPINSTLVRRPGKCISMYKNQCGGSGKIFTGSGFENLDPDPNPGDPKRPDLTGFGSGSGSATLINTTWMTATLFMLQVFSLISIYLKKKFPAKEYKLYVFIPVRLKCFSEFSLILRNVGNFCTGCTDISIFSRCYWIPLGLCKLYWSYFWYCLLSSKMTPKIETIQKQHSPRKSVTTPFNIIVRKSGWEAQTLLFRATFWHLYCCLVWDGDAVHCTAVLCTVRAAVGAPPPPHPPPPHTGRSHRCGCGWVSMDRRSQLFFSTIFLISLKGFLID